MLISNQTNFETSLGSLLWPYFAFALLLLWPLLSYHCSLSVPSLERCIMCFFALHASKHEYNTMASFQTTANIGKIRHKFCLLSFMHRNKTGLLTSFAKINKRGDLNVRGGEKSKN